MGDGAQVKARPTFKRTHWRKGYNGPNQTAYSRNEFYALDMLNPVNGRYYNVATCQTLEEEALLIKGILIGMTQAGLNLAAHARTLNDMVLQHEWATDAE